MFSVCRRWVSGRLGVSQSLGHFILDQLHHVHHHPSHCRPEPLGGFRPGQRSNHVRRWPPAGIRPGWMSEVSFFLSNFFISQQTTFNSVATTFTVINRSLLKGMSYCIEDGISKILHSIFVIGSHSSAVHQLDVLDQLEWAVSQYHACSAVWCQCPCDHRQWHSHS